MGNYYISTCHDCKETVMWSKCPKGWAEIKHNIAFCHFHEGHDTQLFGDYDDESYSRAHLEEYHYFGIMDTDEYIPSQIKRQSDTLRKHVEEIAANGEGLSSEEIFQGAAKREYQIGDYIYLTRLRRVVRLETFEDVEAANTTKPIRPATGKEIVEYIETKNKK